ncbi:hypothetical protein ABB37_06682 [Leptomonas pyrrhocoris]|uniref:SET domain-containing protein n=1 Tax=Leptomonas pyrrhocoris TaxID=157538 RepID=A0A0M9FXC1_LEPPY|nr:hypothetical protein ABB37_06682 [Leptomonas pyrrhocoris]KPA77893.1 hypothetical protein ABB37_06682 [Leptomonas pyrrhocoris]|eukprot:XP_015656332.1 hypothetical protein ABB37_06682 [Leptomonas pyrrhocoris]
MSVAGTATALQHLLEAEGAVIHAALQARALPSMGGGVGMVLTKKLAPGATLARFPFRSMITARKARFNLAMAEVALELSEETSTKAADAKQTSATGMAEEDLFPVVPFTSRVWSESEFESQVRSQKVRRAIDAKVEELEAVLDGTEAIVCYILLMAALHGRWQADASSPQTHDTEEENEQASESSIRSHPSALRFTHENRWMRMWIHALPVQYDNLLELAPSQLSASAAPDVASANPAAGQAPPLFSTAPSSPVPPLPLKTSYTTSSEWLRSYVALARFRASTLRGQHSVEQRYRKCCAALRSLRNMPSGEESDQCSVAQAALADEPEDEAQQDEQHQQPRTSSSSPLPQPAEESLASPCTLGHFLWAFNTLMSRGFFFPEETWAVIPFVDYFNYALDSNGTMFPQEDDPSDAESLSSVSLSMVGTALMPAAAPRKQARRSGLRSAQVGKDAIPLANYNIYEFQLIRPVQAAGEQVMLHYGAYSDVELLMWYGFTLRPSLLPTSHLSPVVTGTCDATNAVVPLLPPGVVEADGSHLLLHTARALHVLLPQIVCAATRIAYYRQQIQPLHVSAEPTTPDGDQPSPATQDETDEYAYNTWAKALNRAYRLPLSPLADAEGNYPPAVRGQTWMDVLFLSFSQTSPLAAPCSENLSASHAAGLKADGWMRQWVAQRWPLFAETASPRVAKGCGLGVLGLSPPLHTAISSSFWAPPKQGRMREAEKIQLVRGIAWAELYVNATAETVAKREAAETAAEVAVSAAAAALAQTAAVDQWALLRFLALEGSDAALEEYLAYESESD